MAPASRLRDPPLSAFNIRGSLLYDVARYLEAHGQDAAALFGRLGFDPALIQTPDARISVARTMDLLDACAQQTGQEDFGLRLADWRGMPDLGPIVLLLRKEATLRGALQTLVRALHLHSNALYLTFDEGEDAAILAMDVMTGAEGFPRQSAEMVVCAVIHMVDWLVGPNWVPASVCLRHPPRLPMSRYLRHLRVQPEFRQEFNGVVIDKSDLDRRLDHSRPRIERRVIEIIDTMSDESALYLYRVQQLMVLTLSRGEARADVIAALLQTSRRTLNRRLAETGQNFSGVLDEVRRDLCVQYVRDSDRRLSEVALLLGFESLSAFSRWFRRGFGQAPQAWRKAHSA